MDIGKMNFGSDSVPGVSNMISDRVCEGCSHDYRTWLLKARQYRDTGKLKRAVDLMDDACKKFPNEEEVWTEAYDLKLLSIAEASRALLGFARLWKRPLDAAERVIRQDRMEGNRRLTPAQLKELGFDKHQQKLKRDLMDFLIEGLQHVPTSVQMWFNFLRLEEETESIAEVQSKAFMAKLRFVEEPALWLAGLLFQENKGATNENIDSFVLDTVQLAIERRKPNVGDVYGRILQLVRHSFDRTRMINALITQGMSFTIGHGDSIIEWLKYAEVPCLRRRIIAAHLIYASAITQFPKENMVWSRFYS